MAVDALDTREVAAAAMLGIRSQLFEQGAFGLNKVARALHLADPAGTGQLEREDFEEALNFASIFLKSPEISALFAFFDRSKSGHLSVADFLVGLRSDLNDRRRLMVLRVFNSMDRDGAGQLPLADVVALFRAAKHPQVIAMRMTEAAMRETFQAGLEAAGAGRNVSRDQFVEFWTEVGAVVPNDDYFISILEAVWGVAEVQVHDAERKTVDRYEVILRDKASLKAAAAEDPRKYLTNVFKFFDTEGRGYLTVDELGRALERVGLPLGRRELVAFFDVYDESHSGKLRYADIVSHTFSA